MSNSTGPRQHVSGKLDLELRARSTIHGRDPGDDVARHQPQGDPVRVLKNDRVVDCQAERRSGRHGGSDRTRKP
jgi:hypothetical protein